MRKLKQQRKNIHQLQFQVASSRYLRGNNQRKNTVKGDNVTAQNSENTADPVTSRYPESDEAKQQASVANEITDIKVDTDSNKVAEKLQQSVKEEQIQPATQILPEQEAQVAEASAPVTIVEEAPAIAEVSTPVEPVEQTPEVAETPAPVETVEQTLVSNETPEAVEQASATTETPEAVEQAPVAEVVTETPAVAEKPVTNTKAETKVNGTVSQARTARSEMVRTTSEPLDLTRELVINAATEREAINKSTQQAGSSFATNRSSSVTVKTSL
ncbi:hypothetical protein ACLKMH_13265 [Psychromonas sp. KJ10-10]|uniref:hypothetical protein n=1 Tax=Psychromonas sp. KJ10-10 TaxID=3391823 RepID=UPI0039B4F2F2